MSAPVSAGTAQAWAVLDGDASLLARVSYSGPSGGLPARLPVRELARASVAVCSLAAAELASVRGRRPVARVRVDDEAVAAAFLSACSCCATSAPRSPRTPPSCCCRAWRR
ncbi:hypothetical protein [Streptomyces sp. NPDC003456]|uniref:hypothetical protein n=1 Tax=Streptomyces sp. NPDC003456 TaxID=3364683 RepID=UPI003673F91C